MEQIDPILIMGVWDQTDGWTHRLTDCKVSLRDEVWREPTSFNIDILISQLRVLFKLWDICDIEKPVEALVTGIKLEAIFIVL